MFRTISVQQLEYLLDGERTFTLLDVREQREYEAGHLLGAVNLPYERLDEVEAEIPKDRPVVIYCAYGGQSLLAARELAGRGYAAFDVYHTKSEMDFKYVISDVFRELSKFISSSTVDELMFTTSSMHYSLKNSAYKSNHRIVKYILYCLYMPDQRDTVLDQSRLTIEHLLNDDGSVRNSSIYNLTLTSGEINSNELKNRGLVEKIGILKSQSSVIANQKLDEYLDAQGEYLEDKRKNDLKEQAISNVFKYEDSPFGYTKEMVDGYLKMKRALQSDEELLAVLLERGMNIQAYLSNNPAMQDAYNRFLTLCGTTS